MCECVCIFLYCSPVARKTSCAWIHPIGLVLKRTLKGNVRSDRSLLTVNQIQQEKERKENENIKECFFMEDQLLVLRISLEFFFLFWLRFFLFGKLSVNAILSEYKINFVNEWRKDIDQCAAWWQRTSSPVCAGRDTVIGTSVTSFMRKSKYWRVIGKRVQQRNNDRLRRNSQRATYQSNDLINCLISCVI